MTTPVLEELYDIDYRELPVMNPGERPRTRVIDMAEDATVLGLHPGPIGQTGIVRVLPPEASEWIDIEENASPNIAVIANDGESVVFNVLDGWTDYGGAKLLTKIWRVDAGIEILPGQILGASIVFGRSSNATCLVGRGAFEPGPDQRSWKWTSEAGQVLLHRPVPVGVSSPVSCSDEGNIAIGNELLGASGIRQDVAIRWVGDGQPEYLYDLQGARLRFAQACNADCTVIVGGDQVDANPDHPNLKEPWLWSEKTGALYLGLPRGVSLHDFAPVVALDVTQDGSFVVGGYSALLPQHNTIGSRGFIWTESTGLVLLPELLETLGLGDDNWLYVSARKVTGNSKTLHVLLAGEYLVAPTPWPETFSRRAAVLDLVPRKTDWF